MQPLDSERFRHVIGHFPSGVTVITTAVDGRRLGTTASAVSSLSLDPPMLLACLKRDSTTRAAVVERSRFGVNILSEDQDALAARFATKGEAKFEGVPFRDGPAGMPLLEGALAHLECDVEDEVVGGTHSVFLGRARGAAAVAGRPLAYFRGAFGRLEIDDPARLGDASDGEPLALRSAIDAQLAIEIGSATLAASRIDRADLAALRNLNERLEASGLGRPTTLERWLEEDGRFHERLVALAGNEELVEEHRRLRANAIAALAGGEVPAGTALVRSCCEDHRATLRALESQDPTALASVMRHHLDPLAGGFAGGPPVGTREKSSG